MSTQLIIAPQIGESPQIAITEEGENGKSWLLSVAAHIQSITEVSGRDLAVIRAGEIKSHLAAVEKTRKEIKEPFFRTGQAIDKAAADHVKSLESELTRLNNLIGSFEKARREKQEAEERARKAEADRVAREAEEARVEAARVADEARKKKEAAAAKGKELTDTQKSKAMEAQLEADERREELAAEARQIEATRMDAALKAQQSVLTGGSLRLDVEIEVTDFHALYTACHQAVRMVPDLPFIKAMWKSKVEYPGVIYRERSNFVTRKQ